MEQFSEFVGYDVSIDDRFLHVILEFFDSEYFHLMESSEYHVIYHHDVRWPQLSGITGGNFDVGETEEGGWEMETYGEGSHARSKMRITTWREITEQTDMCGFDVVTAISQTAVNSQLYNSWTKAKGQRDAVDTILAKWSLEDYFAGTFQPITIRLLSNGSAIIWIHLEEGSLKTLRDRRLYSE